MEKQKVGLIIGLAILMISVNVSIINGEITSYNEENLTRRSTEGFETSTQISQSVSSSIGDNTTWTDYAVDDNQNGYYDRLIIDLGEVNQSAQDFYVLGVLKSSTGTILSLTANGSMYSPMLPYENLTLSFSGVSIRSSGIDGPYNLWIEIIESMNGSSPPSYDFTLMYTTNQAYDHTTFESPSATMIGFADYGRDTDGDSLLNEIVISVTLSVIDPGDYSLTIILGDVDIFSADSQRFSGIWWGYLDPGIQAVEVPIQTTGFYLENLNGPYNLSLAVLASEANMYGYQQMIEGTFQTAAYQYMNFDPIPAYFTGNYWDQGIDTDFDGKFTINSHS